MWLAALKARGESYVPDTECMFCGIGGGIRITCAICMCTSHEHCSREGVPATDLSTLRRIVGNREQPVPFPSIFIPRVICMLCRLLAVGSTNEFDAVLRVLGKSSSSSG